MRRLARHRPAPAPAAGRRGSVKLQPLLYAAIIHPPPVPRTLTAPSIRQPQAEEAVKAQRFPYASILRPGLLERGELARGMEKAVARLMSSVKVSCRRRGGCERAAAVCCACVQVGLLRMPPGWLGRFPCVSDLQASTPARSCPSRFAAAPPVVQPALQVSQVAHCRSTGAVTTVQRVL